MVYKDGKIVKVSELLYERYDTEKLAKAYESLKKEFEEAKSADDIISAREKFLDELDEYSTMVSLAECRYTLDTHDAFYKAEREYYDEVGPKVDSILTGCAGLMLKTPFRSELAGRLPERIYPLYELAEKSFSDEIIGESQLENAIVTEYSGLMASITTEWRGEKKTISHIRGFLDDKDREVRRAAANAIGRALECHSEQLDDIFDRLVRVRTKMAKKLGYRDFVELGYYRMSRIDYDRDMVARFRENVRKDIVPLVCRLKKEISAYIGADEFSFFDDGVIGLPEIPRPFLDSDGIMREALAMFRDMSDLTGKFMQEMTDAGAFDIEAREGKWGGGYCTGFEKYKQPFILANFNGSSDDFETLVHEFGHALAEQMRYLWGDREAGIGSMETAETHSMSMEFFAWKYADRFFFDPDGFRYKHLLGALSFIPYGVIVDEFQHIVYENPDMTPDERNKAYLELEKKYRPYLSYDGIEYLEKGTRWQYQMHIFETPFYYIDYCLAQVVALEFLSESLRDYDSALDKYFAHLKRGGRYPFNRLITMAGLRSPFEDGALSDIADTVSGILKR